MKLTLLTLPVFLLTLWSSDVFGQNVTPQLERIDDPLLSLRSVFQATVTNSEVDAVTANLFLQIRTGNSQSVFEWYRPNVTFPPGITRISQADQLNGVSAFGTGVAATMLNQTGRLAFGDYIVCIKLYGALNNALIAEDCREKSVAPFVPPVLIFPPDGAVLNDSKVDFSWRGPQPAQYFRCTYAFVLVEFDSTESLEWNVAHQPPLIAKTDLPETRLSEMQYTNEFVPGTTYAWRIAAYEGDYVVGETDVWTFTVENEDSVSKQHSGSYRLIKKEPEGGFYFTDNDTLRFAYDNRAHDRVLSYAISPLNDGRSETFAYPEITLREGTNNFNMDLKAIGKFEYDQSYKLVIRDGRHDAYQLIFTHKK